MSIPFVTRFDFEYGRVDQVSPLIRRVIANNPGPFTYTGTGVYIVGRGEVAVIDPGPDQPDHAAALDAALKGERVTQVLLTHAHADHTPLAHPLADRHGAPVRAMSLPGGEREAGVALEAGTDPDFRPDAELADGMVIRGPGWTLEALHTPGHAANHLCFGLKEENALFSGDHVMGWATSVVIPPGGDMDDYLASLERVRALDFDTLWPTHGPPVRDVRPFLDAYIAHRHERERQIMNHLAEGPLRIPHLVGAMYAGLDPKLRPAAGVSVLAHMIRLVRAGRAACEGEPSLDTLYRRA